MPRLPASYLTILKANKHHPFCLPASLGFITRSLHTAAHKSRVLFTVTRLSDFYFHFLDSVLLYNSAYNLLRRKDWHRDLPAVIKGAMPCSSP